MSGTVSRTTTHAHLIALARTEAESKECERTSEEWHSARGNKSQGVQLLY